MKILLPIEITVVGNSPFDINEVLDSLESIRRSDPHIEKIEVKPWSYVL